MYYAYSTNTGGPLLPAMTSTDLETWVAHEAWSPNRWNADPFYNDALVRPPRWADRSGGGEVWAPFVMELGGTWLAYYAIRESRGRYCISVAAGPDPLGPFEDRSAEPITCGHGPAGAIDPWVHVDDRGRPWLVWKTEPYSEADHETGPMPAAIWSHRLTADGGELRPDPALLRPDPEVGADGAGDGGGAEGEEDDDVEPSDGIEPNLLLAAGAPWEAGIVENPAIVEIDGELILFYSGNRWASHEYATGWARCSSIVGPCRRGAEEPFLAAEGDWNGPGGASVFTNGWDELTIAFHAWNPPYVSYPDFPACDTDGDGHCTDQGQRFLHIDVLCWLTDGRPHVGVPDDVPFCDVRPDAWETEPITWMADSGLTTGVSPAHFAPDRTVQRAEAVTFLWRMAGRPVVNGRAPFTDVPAGAFYAAAVAWAFEVGVIHGTSPTSFSPHDPLTRGQMAIVLHRSAAEPERSTPAPFDDVMPTAFSATAVDWLAGTGVTTGTGPNSFSPSGPVTRAQLAAFLCRYAGVDLAQRAVVAGIDSVCAAS